MRSAFGLVVLCSISLACGYSPQAKSSDGVGGAGGGGAGPVDAAAGFAAEARVDAGDGESGKTTQPLYDAGEAGQGSDAGSVPGGGIGGAGGAGGLAGGTSAGPDAGTVAAGGGPGFTGSTAGQVGGGGAGQEASGGTSGLAGTTAGVASPVIDKFSASLATIAAGQSSVLSWEVSGATRLTIEPDLGVVTASPATVNPSKTTEYTLTAANGAGVSVSRKVTVTVVFPPKILRFSVSPEVISEGSAVTLEAVFVGADTASIDQDIGVVGNETKTRSKPLTKNTTYTLTVTNALGETITAKVMATVVPLPTITSFRPVVTPIVSGQVAQLVAEFSSGTGFIQPGNWLAASGTPVGTGSLTTSSTYTLTVTNLAGDKKTASTTVVVVAPGSFASVPMLERIGSAHTATQLQNGKVLIAGGVTGRTEYRHAEIFDPETQTFAATGSMNASRIWHTATLLINGKVLICGGDPGNNTALATAELYDPDTGVFTPTGSMISARSYHAASLLLDGTVLVSGGQNDGPVGRLELYDPATGKFKEFASSTLRSCTHHVQLSLVDPNQVLFLGGNFGRELVSYNLASQTFSTQYLTTTRDWPNVTPMPNRLLLVSGGQGDGTGVLKSAEVFDLASGTSSPTGDMAGARARHASALLDDGQVLVVGGQGNTAGVIHKTAELYNPTAKTFAATGSMNHPRMWPTVTPLTGRRVLVVGGASEEQDPGAELYFY